MPRNIIKDTALLDHVLVRIDHQETYDYFKGILDQPPGGKGFERLMQAPKPWVR